MDWKKKAEEYSSRLKAERLAKQAKEAGKYQELVKQVEINRLAGLAKSFVCHICGKGSSKPFEQNFGNYEYGAGQDIRTF